MIRYGTAILIAAGACVAAGVAACSDSIEPGVTTGTGGSAGSGAGGGGTSDGGSGNTGGGGGGAPASMDDKCSAECCPTDAACYSDATKASSSPGAACLATRDNSDDKKHVSLRQTWIRATAPKGNVGGGVYSVLSGRTELPLKTPMPGMDTMLPDCKMNAGVVGYGGYMQLTDMYFANGAHGSMPDYDKDFAYTGFSTYVSTTNVLSSVKDGFCMGTQGWTPDNMPTDYKKYELGPDEMSPMTDFKGNPWPEGLPPPMPLKDAAGTETPWQVTSTKAKRLDKDFDLKTDRLDILKKLAKTGEYGSKGFNGVFYYDAATGIQHSYGPLGWVVVYNGDGTQHIAIPARETEIRAAFNDPKHPNCIGVYGQTIDPSTTMPTVTKANNCTNTQDGTPAWGGGNCTASTGNATCKIAEGPFATNLYFLITELEQVYSADLVNTLCVTYPTGDALKMQANGGFFNDTLHSCKGTAWNPSKADGSGLPKGDWCAATNSPADDKCHDAWQSKNFHTFAGANILIDSATNEPKQCPL